VRLTPARELHLAPAAERWNWKLPLLLILDAGAVYFPEPADAPVPQPKTRPDGRVWNRFGQL